MTYKQSMLQLSQAWKQLCLTVPEKIRKTLPFPILRFVLLCKDQYSCLDLMTKANIATAEIIVQTCIDNHLIRPEGKSIVVAILLHHAFYLSVHTPLSQGDILNIIYAKVITSIERISKYSHDNVHEYL